MNMKRISSFIKNIPKQERIQVSLNYQMDEHIVVYLYNKIQFINRKGKKLLIQVTTWVDLKIIMLSERIHKHTKYLLYDSIYMKF